MVKYAFSCCTVALVLLTSSAVGSEVPGVPPDGCLLRGSFKWLLHLGQNPTDRFLTWYAPDPRGLEPFMGRPFVPFPGQIYDFEDLLGWGLPTTSKMLIWTPQYSPTGVFAENMPDGDFSQLYHIYVFSPERRQARLWFKARSYCRAWNGQELVFDWKNSSGNGEAYADILLLDGTNSMTFALRSSSYEPGSLFSARITDCNDQEFPDLTFSLDPPLPSGVTYVCRDLPVSYDADGTIDVSLSVSVDANDRPADLAVIEYVPEGTSVADVGTGTVVGNTIQWSLPATDANRVNLSYSLAIPSNKTGAMAFSGYFYLSKSLREIVGENVLFRDEPASASDMAGTIQTIEIDPARYSGGEDVVVGHLDDVPYYLVTGLRAGYTGGWADYDFTVVHLGKYQIVLDYGEYWTMFHQSADVRICVDGEINLTTSLPPTTHSYDPDFSYTRLAAARPEYDPDRKAKWIVGSVELAAGVHTLRVTFSPMYPADPPATCYYDGRPVINRIILTNYPGLTVPGLAEPHHLDSYEHAPAMFVQDRDIQQLPDGTVEMTFHATFHSLSQGDEIYFVDGHVRPRVDQSETKFEIVSMNPEWFYIAPNGEQEFTLAVRSKEPIPAGYSELVMVWLQGVPEAPSRRLHLFSTCQDYLELPPYKAREFPWDFKPLFHSVFQMSAMSLCFNHTISDRADMFVPDRKDLRLDTGRYERGLAEFFQDQLCAGKLPSIQQILLENGWDYANLGNSSWGLWSKMLSALYWGDNLDQAKAYIAQGKRI
jgi:hypothetical protein